MSSLLNEPIENRYQAAIEFAREVGKTVLRYYQDAELKVETKRDKTLVTEADQLVEKELRELILGRFKDDGIIGEEGSNHEGNSGYVWILDPIDGTESFVCGVPFFGTMIGITYLNEPVIGVVNMPALNEIYFAARGAGSWWQKGESAAPIAARASKVTELKKSLFLTTSHSGFDRIERRDLFNALLDQTKKFRGWGSCYGHMLVATGRADLMVDPEVKLWDCAALYPILTEAGGKFFDLKGRPRIDSGSAVSCAAGIEIPLIALLT